MTFVADCSPSGGGRGRYDLKLENISAFPFLDFLLAILACTYLEMTGINTIYFLYLP